MANRELEQINNRLQDGKEKKLANQKQRLSLFSILSLLLAPFPLMIAIDFVTGWHLIARLTKMLNIKSPFPLFTVMFMSFIASFLSGIIAESNIKKSGGILKGKFFVYAAMIMLSAVVFIGLLTFSWILFYGRE
jgi:hypothetical protein